MEENTQKVDFSFSVILKYLSNIYFVFLLIFGIVLFDDLEIMVFRNGLLDTDFSEFASLSNIPFLLLFLAVFGIVNAGLSPLVNTFIFWFYNILPCTKNEKTENTNRRISLLKMALIAENSFMIKYLNSEYKMIDNMKKFSCAVYSLLFSIIFNLVITLSNKQKTTVY